MNINGKEDEKLPDYVMSFSGENCHVSVLPIIPPPSSTQVIPTNNFLPDNPPSPIVWSTHNFVFHKFPQPLVLAKCKDSRLKLHQSMVGESQVIAQGRDKLQTTVCGDQLVLWDQHTVHERIRLEEMMVSTLKPGDSHSLRAVSLGLVGTEDTTSIIIMDIPCCFSSLDTDLQVQLCCWS